MARMSRRRLAQTIVRLLREQPQQRPQILRSAAAYLVMHKQANQLHLLISDIARELAIREDHLFAEVTSAFALDAPTRQALTAYLQTQTGAKTIELAEQIDTALLAGVVIRTADQQLDTSARHKLRQLAGLDTLNVSGGTT